MNGKHWYMKSTKLIIIILLLYTLKVPYSLLNQKCKKEIALYIEITKQAKYGGKWGLTVQILINRLTKRPLLSSSSSFFNLSRDNRLHKTSPDVPVFHC